MSECVDVDDELVRVAYESYRDELRAVLTGASRDALRDWVDLPSDVSRAWRVAVETIICRWEHVV